jgi:hypothetical protein
MAEYEAPTITELGTVAEFTSGHWGADFGLRPEDRGGIPHEGSNGRGRGPAS